MTNTILALFLILLSSLSYRQSYAQDNDADPNSKSMTDASKTQDSEKQTMLLLRQDAKSVYENQRLALEQQYPADSIIQLSANGENFIGLWEKDKSGTPVGTVLILHGEGQTANWPHTIDVLRTNLSLIHI